MYLADKLADAPHALRNVRAGQARPLATAHHTGYRALFSDLQWRWSGRLGVCSTLLPRATRFPRCRRRRTIASAQCGLSPARERTATRCVRLLFSPPQHAPVARLVRATPSEDVRVQLERETQMSKP